MKKHVAFLIIIILLSIAKPAYSAELTKIMGEGKLSPESMYLYLITNNKDNGLNPINQEYAKNFVIITIQEANAEGVRFDVAFALMMHETGFLNFGGDVAAAQNNFGGLGAVGGGAKGAQFSDMRLGIRAVVQHLKCYASTEPLNGETVDPRWAEYLRGKAEYVEHLGKADNPEGYGWAVPGKGYGSKVMSMISAMNKLDVSSVGAITVPAFNPAEPDRLIDVDPYKKIEDKDKEDKNDDEETQENSGSLISLLKLNSKNIINFAVALVIAIAVIAVARFKSKTR